MCASTIEQKPDGTGRQPRTVSFGSRKDRAKPVATRPLQRPAATSRKADEPISEKFKLRVLSGLSEGREFQLTRALTTIGRLGGGADIEIDDPQVSGSHCAVEIMQGAALLHDLRSTNGTYLRNAPISVVRLEPGVDFRIGSSRLQLDPI